MNSFDSLWDVFLLFTIPIGGGIPAGVVLAQKRGIDWLTMSALYLVSDIALAIAFEPLMRGVAWVGRRVAFVARVSEHMKRSTERQVTRYGAKPGPVLLIAIAFGVDPMTGRAAAFAQGHGFFAGWAIAIAGDMLFFFLIMISTIWLNGVLGDGTWTAVIIMVAMMVIPMVVRRIRSRYIRTL